MEEILNQFSSIPNLKPAIYVLSGLLLAMIFQRIIFKRLHKICKGTKWHWDDVIVKSFGNTPILLFVLAGSYFAVADVAMDPVNRELANRFLFGLFMLAVALIFSRMTGGFIKLYAQKTHGGLPATSIFSVLAKITIYTLMLLVVLQTYGISITPLLTALGVGGLAVALALQDTLSNLFAGIHLIASKKIKPGDYVEMDTVNSGFVDDISWRSTTIRTTANNLIISPNSKISSAIITNYSRPKKELSVLVNGSVAYSSDLEKTEKIILEEAKKLLQSSERAVADFEPLVRFNEFADSGIKFVTVLRAREFTDQYALKHEFVKALHARFKKEGIEIPYPQMDVHMDK